jgi:PKD repeat protein
LPPGLEVYNYYDYGYISGTPTQSGTYTFTITATNAGGSDSKQFTITVEAPPTITTNSLPNGEVGASYSATITADKAATWYSNNLPYGLSLSPSGVISGEPLYEGDYSFTISAQNFAGNSSKSFSISIAAQQFPTISTASMAKGYKGESYGVRLKSASLSAVWSKSAGNLPTGLSLNSSGIISGTPTATGTFTFTVRTVNNEGTDEKELKIIIDEPPAPVIITKSLPNAIVGSSYREYVTADRNATFSITGLPPGLKFSCESYYCQISGVPTLAGAFNITVKVTNAGGEDTENFAFAVNASTPTISAIKNVGSLKAWINGGTLHLSGLTVGKTWSIYNAKGTMLQSGTAHKTEMNVKLNIASGIYFVKINGQTMRIINK